jgi:predicted regulator of Ras-like GTPase activity (Roadblock/LC7/MglB family)
MPTLRDLVQTLVQRPGVSAALVFGRDGLLVEVAGLERPSAEPLAALAPGLLAAADALGRAAGRGALVTAVLEHGDALAVASALTHDVALLVLLAPGSEPGTIVHELRRARAGLAALV